MRASRGFALGVTVAIGLATCHRTRGCPQTAHEAGAPSEEFGPDAGDWASRATGRLTAGDYVGVRSQIAGRLSRAPVDPLARLLAIALYAEMNHGHKLDDVLPRWNTLLIESSRAQVRPIAWRPTARAIDLQTAYLDIRGLGIPYLTFQGNSATPEERATSASVDVPPVLVSSETIVDYISTWLGPEGTWARPAYIGVKNAIVIVRHNSEVQRFVRAFLDELLMADASARAGR